MPVSSRPSAVDRLRTIQQHHVQSSAMAEMGPGFYSATLFDLAALPQVVDQHRSVVE